MSMIHSVSMSPSLLLFLGFNIDVRAHFLCVCISVHASVCDASVCPIAFFIVTIVSYFRCARLLCPQFNRHAKVTILLQRERDSDCGWLPPPTIGTAEGKLRSGRRLRKDRRNPQGADNDIAPNKIGNAQTCGAFQLWARARKEYII